jgi:hypothetical protein
MRKLLDRVQSDIDRFLQSTDLDEHSRWDTGQRRIRLIK